MQYTVDLIKPSSTVYKGLVAELDRLRALSKRALKTSEAARPERRLDSASRIRGGNRAAHAAVLRERILHVAGEPGVGVPAPGQYNRAAEYLQQIQDSWPRVAGAEQGQLEWYHELEKYQLKLAKKRYRESLRRPAAQGNERRPSSMADSVDDLFEDGQGPLQYKAEDGTYQAGTLAEAQPQKLPPHAPWRFCSNSCCGFRTIPGSTGNWVNSTTRTGCGAAAHLHECIWTRRYDVPSCKSTQDRGGRGAQAVGPGSGRHELQDRDEACGQSGDWLPNGGRYLVGGVAGTIALAALYLQVREFRQRRRQHRK